MEYSRFEIIIFIITLLLMARGLTSLLLEPLVKYTKLKLSRENNKIFSILKVSESLIHHSPTKKEIVSLIDKYKDQEKKAFSDEDKKLLETETAIELTKILSKEKKINDNSGLALR